MANVISDGSGSSFSIGDYIGRGSFSKVYTLECILTKNRFAGKFISREKLTRYGILKSVWNEIKIHQQLRHKYIVQFLSFIEREKDIVIILEYCSRYSMVNVLHDLKTLTLGESKYFMNQIVSAVEYLHFNNIVHRDLKLGNLFVNKKLEIKLGDFGLAVVIEFKNQKRFSRCGTPNYLAPEVINAVGYSFEVDIWGIGCILYTMLEGTPPFQGQNTTSTYNNILKCSYNFSNRINPSAKELIMCCLQPDPCSRPSVFQLKDYEYFVSEKICQEPPEFTIKEDETISFDRKRGKVSEAKPAKPLQLTVVDPELCDHFHGCLIKLLNSLRHVRDWHVSDFGECLAEHKYPVPLVWVNSWMDYSNLYGFAYKLSNNNSGIVFNDDTRILYLVNKGLIHYTKRDESVLVFQKDKVPEILRKKTKLLVICQNYMKGALKKAHEANNVSDQGQSIDTSPEVSVWFKGENEMVMFLTNGSIQVNFFEDHTKLILCGFSKTVTTIEGVEKKIMKTVKLNTLQSCGCTKGLRAKLSIVQKHIFQFLSDKDLLNSGWTGESM